MKNIFINLLILFIIQSCNVSDLSKYLENGMNPDETRDQLNGQGYEGNGEYFDERIDGKNPDEEDEDNQKEILYQCISFSGSLQSFYLEIQEDEYGDKFIYDKLKFYQVNQTVFNNPDYGDVIYHSSNYSLLIRDENVSEPMDNYTWFGSIITLNSTEENISIKCRRTSEQEPDPLPESPPGL